MTPVPSGFKWGGPKFQKAWNQMCQAVVDRTTWPGNNMSASDQPGYGRLLNSDRQSATVTEFPYQVYLNTSDNPGLKISVRPGAHNSHIPEIEEDGLEEIPPPYLTLSGDGTHYVYVVLTTDSDGAEDELKVEEFTSEQVNDDPNGDGTSGTFYDLLSTVTVVDGAILVINPIVNNSRAWLICLSVTFSY